MMHAHPRRVRQVLAAQPWVPDLISRGSARECNIADAGRLRRRTDESPRMVLLLVPPSVPIIQREAVHAPSWGRISAGWSPCHRQASRVSLASHTRP
jgi:hypothetical protein